MLTERIGAFVRSEGTESFASIARAAFAFQCERLPAVRRLAIDSGLDPEGLEDWRRAPLVPTLAFKTQTLATAPARELFHSSGTTAETPSVHHHGFPELYRTVIDASFPAACLGQMPAPPMLSAVPNREVAPRSSLAFMVDHVLASWGGSGSLTVATARGIDTQRTRGFLAARQRDRRPTLVLATAFSLNQLLEALDRIGLAFRLPPGSRVFETGGVKGRTRELARSQLLAAVEQRLGVPASSIIREYGMTELTSQCYAGTSPQADRDLFEAPPWVRFRVLDPETLTEVAPGTPGLLAIFDLANLSSALHVLTEDLAVAHGSGFKLVGRAAGAELRGCSLLSEELAG